jgi:hypothetical protein
MHNQNHVQDESTSIEFVQIAYMVLLATWSSLTETTKPKYYIYDNNWSWLIGMFVFRRKFWPGSYRDLIYHLRNLENMVDFHIMVEKLIFLFKPYRLTNRAP